jgi:hypothetical protein
MLSPFSCSSLGTILCHFLLCSETGNDSYGPPPLSANCECQIHYLQLATLVCRPRWLSQTMQSGNGDWPKASSRPAAAARPSGHPALEGKQAGGISKWIRHAQPTAGASVAHNSHFQSQNNTWNDIKCFRENCRWRQHSQLRFYCESHIKFFLGQHIDLFYWVQDTQQNKSIIRRPNWRNPAL